MTDVAVDCVVGSPTLNDITNVKSEIAYKCCDKLKQELDNLVQRKKLLSCYRK